MNNVTILGRLTRDPDLRYVQGGQNGQTAVARFTVAVDRGMSKEKRAEAESQGRPTADFVSCVAWGKLAENLAKYSRKGLRVCVEGRIETGSYEKDGKTVYTTDVRCSNIEFVDWGNQSNNPDAQGQAPAYNPQQPQYNNPPQYGQQQYGQQQYGQPQYGQPQGFGPSESENIPF